MAGGGRSAAFGAVIDLGVSMPITRTVSTVPEGVLTSSVSPSATSTTVPGNGGAVRCRSNRLRRNRHRTGAPAGRANRGRGRSAQAIPSPSASRAERVTGQEVKAGPLPDWRMRRSQRHRPGGRATWPGSGSAGWRPGPSSRPGEPWPGPAALPVWPCPRLPGGKRGLLAGGRPGLRAAARSAAVPGPGRLAGFGGGVSAPSWSVDEPQPATRLARSKTAAPKRAAGINGNDLLDHFR